jgi:hypothetical protein
MDNGQDKVLHSSSGVGTCAVPGPGGHSHLLFGPDCELQRQGRALRIKARLRVCWGLCVPCGHQRAQLLHGSQ